jgi:hypothetical protein
MSDVSIGYYAHHHGSGHVRRAVEIARYMTQPLTIFSSTALPEGEIANVTSCILPMDVDDGNGDGDGDTRRDIATVPSFHYAPTGLFGIAERMGVLAQWFHAQWPCLLVVDVSVEVALFARLCSVPTIYLRQNGERGDLPHTLAYGGAEALLAPFPDGLGLRDRHDPWAEKTVYTGFISRLSKAPFERSSTSRSVLVLIGYGGSELTGAQVAAAAAATPAWQWTVLGPLAAEADVRPLDNLRFVGVVDAPHRYLDDATVVVGSAGDSVVAEMAFLRCRYIAVPAARPFNEQTATACALARFGVAIACLRWPDAADWPDLLQRALALDIGRWEALTEQDGAPTAARAIQHIAERVGRQRARVDL